MIFVKEYREEDYPVPDKYPRARNRKPVIMHVNGATDKQRQHRQIRTADEPPQLEFRWNKAQDGGHKHVTRQTAEEHQEKPRQSMIDRHVYDKTSKYRHQVRNRRTIKEYVLDTVIRFRIPLHFTIFAIVTAIN